MGSTGPARGRGVPWRNVCLVTWGVFLCVLCYELFPRMEGAWSKTPWGREQPWQGGIQTFKKQAENVALADLFHPAPRLKLDPRRMDRSRTLLWFRDRVSGGLETANSWPNAVLVHALIDSAEPRRGEIEKYWNQLIGPGGKWLDPPQLLSHCMVGMPLLEWHQRTAEDRYRVAAERLVEWLLVTHPRSPSGTLPYRPEEPNILLVDSLGMICPLLARFGREHGRPEAVALAKQQLIEFLDNAIDARSGLPFHAYQVGGGTSKKAFGLAGWGRGVGWLALGLTGTIPWLTPEDPDRLRFEVALRDLMNGVREHQREDGLWGWALNIPGAEPDTSATGMLAWVLRRGVQSGSLMREEFEGVQRKAVKGILQYTTSTGEVGQSMADAAGVGQYPWLFGHTTWTQGFAVLAAGGLSDE